METDNNSMLILLEAPKTSVGGQRHGDRAEAVVLRCLLELPEHAGPNRTEGG